MREADKELKKEKLSFLENRYKNKIIQVYNVIKT